MASGQFDNLHSPSLPLLEASSMKEPEAGIYAQYANAFGISVEEVHEVFKADQRVTGHSIPYILDAFRVFNFGQFQNSIAAYNRANPLSAIHQGEKGPRSSYGAATQPLPAYNPAPLEAGTSPLQAIRVGELVGATQPITQSSLPFTGAGLGFGGSKPAPQPTLADILQAALNGAVKGGTDKALETQAGKDAKAAGFRSFLQDNQLFIGLGGAGVLALAYKAFKK